jgi:hypothetical protein
MVVRMLRFIASAARTRRSWRAKCSPSPSSEANTGARTGCAASSAACEAGAPDAEIADVVDATETTECVEPGTVGAVRAVVGVVGVLMLVLSINGFWGVSWLWLEALTGEYSHYSASASVHPQTRHHPHYPPRPRASACPQQPPGAHAAD